MKVLVGGPWENDDYLQPYEMTDALTRLMVSESNDPGSIHLVVSRLLEKLVEKNVLTLGEVLDICDPQNQESVTVKTMP